MIKKVTYILLVSLLTSVINSYSQTIERVELTPKEIKYLGSRISNGFDKFTNEQMNNSIATNMINYEFEILYNTKPVYRGVINKPFATNSFSEGIYRTEVGFCLDYDIFDPETKLELIESRIFYKVETKEGNKYLCNGHYRLFKLGKSEPNDQLSTKVKIKFYKLTYK